MTTMTYPVFLQTLLAKRGLTEIEEIEKFLNPDYDRDSHDPFLLPDMDKAVERILEAINKNEKVIIFSDYDADGIPGGVVLHDFFEKIKFANFTNYIPHRHNEGFGLNEDSVQEFKKQGVKLIITIDCGIADVAEAKLIKKLGIDLIITDHHEPGLELPPAVAVVDPKRKDSQYPFKDLCGSGVIFKVIQGVLLSAKSQKKLSEKFPKNPLHLTQTNHSGEILETFPSDVFEVLPTGWEKWLLDMVGIATLSDMVPLVGENRALAYYGLKVLRKSPRIGLMKLLRQLKIEQRLITEDDIGFSISPRINAASRMGNPEDAFNLFIAKDEGEADVLAKHLDKINSERKGVVASMVKEVRKTMEKRLADGETNKGACPNPFQGRVLVIGNPLWKPSLLGLVANSLKDDHGCPVFLWGRDGGNILKGSARSDGSVDLVALMQEVEKIETGIFADFGGHAMSGGFSVLQDKLHLLEEKLNMAYGNLISVKEDGASPELNSDFAKADMVLTLNEVTVENYRLLEKMAPFGTGNPKPLFLFEKVEILGVKMFGKENNHLELILGNASGQRTSPNLSQRRVKAIGFFLASSKRTREGGLYSELKVGERINLLANFEFSTFRGFNELRLRIVNIKLML